MVTFQGQERFPFPVSAVYRLLSDASFLARSLPDAQVLEAERDRASWKVRPKLAFISGSLETEALVIERQENSTVTYRLQASGIGAGSTIDATLHFQELEEQTTISWTGTITAMTGMMKLVPKGLIQAAAQKVIDENWQAVQGAVAQELSESK